MKQPFQFRGRRALHFFACSVLAISGLPAITSATGHAPLQSQQIEAALPQIETYIQASMQAWQVPGLAIGIVADDELVYAKGFGVREAGSRDAVDASTLFQIGSTTKAFLGFTEAMLVDRGKLAWTDKVVDHYPGFRLADPWATQHFEISDLLAQRSGLPYSTLTNMMLYDYPRADIIKALQFIEPVSSFRSTFAYQNAFHLVAGEIVARVAGTENWETFLQSELLDALGMSSSSHDAQAMSQSTNRASGHRRVAQEVVADPWAPFPYNAGGAGNLNSNIQDMSRWLRLQINQGEIDGKRIISHEALAQTHLPRIAVTGPMQGLMKHGAQGDISYATGWVVHSTPQGRIIEHSGGTSGYTSHVAFDPDRRFGLVLLTNLSVDIGTGLALPLGKYIIDLLQGRATTDYAAQMLATLQDNLVRHTAGLRAPPNARPARPLHDYTGSYTSPTLGKVALELNGHGKLSFALGPREIPVELEPWSGDVFITSALLPAYGPDPYLETRKLRFLTDMQDNIAGFDWSDEVDSGGQPPFRRVESSSNRK